MFKMIKQFEYDRLGSALIMTIVLTVLLAIVAVMFVAVARMDSAATSNIAENKTLDLAAESIIDILNRQLISDTPGLPSFNPLYYYDYPDSHHPWLASNEPYLQRIDGGTYSVYKWGQISDVTNFLSGKFAIRNINVDPEYGSGSGNQEVIKDYSTIKLNTNKDLDPGNSDDGIADNENRGQLADADGDGIADSKWFELADMRSSKGGKIYAAVRVIDNSGMVNVNTAHTFDAASATIGEIDGTTQMQINLKESSGLFGMLKGTDTIANLHNARWGTAPLPQTWAKYQTDVIWQYGLPALPATGSYTPFDISDELELRYRYCIDSKFKSRLEDDGVPPVIPVTLKGYGITANRGDLYDGGSNWGLTNWQNRITNPADASTDRRHLLTTMNLDRIIRPDGAKMININDPATTATDIYNALYNPPPNGAGISAPEAAQITANIMDYRDPDSIVTVFPDPLGGPTNYYGFETPCVYISELVYQNDGAGNTAWALELHKPYSADADPAGWKIYVSGSGFEHTVTWGTGQFYVLTDTSGTFLGDESDDLSFGNGDTIYLTRTAANGDEIVVDSVRIDAASNLITTDNQPHSLERDITQAKCIRRLWASTANTSHTLDAANSFDGGGDYIQAHPKNGNFTNIGEIGMVFRKAAYYPYVGGSENGVIGYDITADEESEVFVDLTLPAYQPIFNYLTVIDHPTDTAETRIKGRININTAPAFVLAQLPWVSLRGGTYNDPNLAEAIVAYRDISYVPNGGPDYRTRPGNAGFENIGQLCNVNIGNDNYVINYYERLPGDQLVFPDLSGGEGASDDFEERDLIFARISDLVTVRSDIFTVYILVRVCTNVNSSNEVQGPQKRYIAIIDRSEVTPTNQKVKIKAFGVVPEAR